MIRNATVNDIPQLMDIGRRFHHAGQYAKFGLNFSETKLQAVLDSNVTNEDACVFVCEIDGAIKGVACAVKTQPFMSDDDLAVELYWWVDPAARGGVTAIRLMERLEAWSLAVGCKALAMSSIALVEGSPADAIYSRRGYLKMESTWIKEV